MIKPEKAEYIDGRPDMGIAVNWDLVRKNFAKIVPAQYRKNYHNPLDAHPEDYSYYMDLSDRDRGKTTNKLIVGLILYAMYGVNTVYMRTKTDDIERRNISTLFDAILERGYIQKIFGEPWNSIDYSSYRWCVCEVDESGKIAQKMPGFFAIALATEKAMRYKSRLVLPRADFIVYDEFIEPDYPSYTMEYFQQNLKTVLRSRKSGVILMSSNAINLNSPWFSDFKIRREVKHLKAGEHAVIDVDGTTFYVDILAEDKRAEKKQYNKKYLGFADHNMQSISGRGVWEMRQYPHIRREFKDCKIIARNVYVQHLGDLLNISLAIVPDLGLCGFVRPATKTYSDSVIFTLGEITDRRHIYKIGESNAPTAVIWRLYRQNRMYYATNECGELLRDYYTNAQKL